MQMSVFNNAAKTGTDDEESYVSEKEDVNRKHSALILKGNLSVPIRVTWDALLH